MKHPKMANEGSAMHIQRILTVFLNFLILSNSRLWATDSVPEPVPYIKAGSQGLILKELPKDATDLTDRQKCFIEANSVVDLAQPPRAYSLTYLSIRLKNPLPECDILEGFVYNRHVAAQSPVYYPFEKTEYWLQTKSKGTFFKINEQDSGNLERGTGKCAMDPNARYYLDAVPGRISSAHLRISLVNLIPSCRFTHGYVYAGHIAASSHPSVLINPFQNLGELNYKGRIWKASWSQAIAAAIPQIAAPLLQNDFVPHKDVASLCPGYFTATEHEKTSFWTLFIASIAWPESGWNPSPAPFKEPGLYDEYGQVYSEGMLQLSLGDGIHGSVCDFRRRDDIRITDAADNLRCGLVILKNQISRRKALFLPQGFYYWSVLTNQESTVRRVFNSQLNKLSFCF